MAIDGTWSADMETPMGVRTISLQLASAGTTLTGKMSGSGGSVELFDGHVDGNKASWRADITQPMPLSGAPGAALAWGGHGHLTVAAIAMNLISEKAARMSEILAQLEIDNNFIDAASYPDEFIREHDPERKQPMALLQSKG
jgi:hypothetical protein